MAQENNFHLDIECRQKFHVGELICGDVFLSRKIKEEGRTVVVLSDGMGSGVKANVLATLTASMAINFTAEHKDLQSIAAMIMETLPVCSVRKVSYSTFTIVDIEEDGTTTIVEYDNPETLILRGHTVFDPIWSDVILNSEINKGKELKTCTFKAQKNDRIFFWSDGIVQSGMGSKAYPFGYGREALSEFVQQLVIHTPDSSSNRLAQKVVNMAAMRDGDKPLDDCSCGVIYFREPRTLLLASGPAYEMKNDLDYALRIQAFEGKKIIAGGTTAEIVARELKLKFDINQQALDSDLPPTSFVEGIDLVTEGILTLAMVAKILDRYTPEKRLGLGPADQVVKLLLESDNITVFNGTQVNIAHHDPTLPMELEIRRTVLKRIVHLLETKFLKVVRIEYF